MTDLDRQWEESDERDERCRAAGWDGHYTGETFAADKRLNRLALSLGRPVAQDLLDIAHARITLLDAVLKAERSEELAHYSPTEIFHGLCWVLDQRVAAVEAQADIADALIKRAVKPLIAQRVPVARLLEIGDAINAQRGLPLSSSQVLEAVRTEIWWALPARTRKRG